MIDAADGSSDTVFALSSGALPAGIAVVRITGPQAHAVGSTLAGTLPPARRAALRRLHDPRDGTPLDDALVLRFDRPASATGEDMVELHLHGSRAVVRAVGEALTWAGARAAEAGAFTRRALENGRLDLTQAEGLADLLAAETATQHRAAMRLAEGGLRRQIESWRDRLTQHLAVIEAAIEFAEDEDLEIALPPRLADLGALRDDIERALATPPAERLREGLRVVIGGSPNRGKSTLFNRLVGREAAIVTPVAGTTRDVIEAVVERDGIAFVLVDTAGLTESDDPVERIGVARARSQVDAADIVLWLDEAPPPTTEALLVSSFADQSDSIIEGRWGVSGVTGAGVDALWGEIVRRARTMLPMGDAIALNARQRSAVADAFVDLDAAASDDVLLVAEHLRAAWGSLGRVLGNGDSEAVLDAVFTSFCIGK